MKIQGQLWNQKGLDAAVENVPEDRYGFRVLAEKLARSIISMDRNISTVIGIEGKWGSGKTSLLNLLLKEMVPLAPEKTHVLKIAPLAQFLRVNRTGFLGD